MVGHGMQIRFGFKSKLLQNLEEAFETRTLRREYNLIKIVLVSISAFLYKI